MCVQTIVVRMGGDAGFGGGGTVASIPKVFPLTIFERTITVLA